MFAVISLQSTLSHRLLRVDHTSRVFKNIGSKREDVVGSWKILHNEELRNFYTSPNIIKIMKSGIMR